METNKENKEEIKDNSHINHLNVTAKKSMMSRILISIILVIIVVPCIILGDYIFLCLIFVASVFATHEIVKAPQSIERKFSNVIYIFSYTMMILLIYWIFIKNNIASYVINKENYVFNLYNNFNTPTMSLSAFAISIAFLYAMVFFDKKFTIHDAFYFICMLFMVSIGFQAITYLRFYPSTEIGNRIIELHELINMTSNQGDIELYQNEITTLIAKLNNPTFKYLQSVGLLFYLLLGVCLNDVGAYFVGVLFGKHKLCPNISPKKTWEGFIGGIFVSLAGSLTFGLLLAHFGYPILNVLDMDHWYNIVVLSIVMPLVGTFGDLLFSSIKRFYKIKDFGQVLKSHGGILDRLDSLLISSIAISLFIPLMEHTWLIYL